MPFCRFSNGSNDQVVKIITAYFSEELEPFPGAQSAPGTDVALDDEQTHLLVVSSLEILESQVRSKFFYDFYLTNFPHLILAWKLVMIFPRISSRMSSRRARIPALKNIFVLPILNSSSLRLPSETSLSVIPTDA